VWNCPKKHGETSGRHLCLIRWDPLHFLQFWGCPKKHVSPFSVTSVEGGKKIIQGKRSLWPMARVYPWISLSTGSVTFGDLVQGMFVKLAKNI
jgi:hypothetical protein